MRRPIISRPMTEPLIFAHCQKTKKETFKVKYTYLIIINCMGRYRQRLVHRLSESESESNICCLHTYSETEVSPAFPFPAFL